MLTPDAEDDAAEVSVRDGILQLGTVWYGRARDMVQYGWLVWYGAVW